ncbi:MAG: SUMF1/EgtB/PvdO family nonheme iron enzyme [Rhodovibrionaceae bacterium]
MMKAPQSIFLACLLALSLAACETMDSVVDLGASAEPETVGIPAGRFVQGSSPEQRDYAYTLDELATGSARSRDQRLYARELEPQWIELPAFEIAATPITNAQYAAFVEATGHPAPDVDQETWLSYRQRLGYEATRPYAWNEGRPPEGRADHPVVLVDYEDALAYAAWLSEETGRTWRLPSEAEWEKAARGDDGRTFPWGNAWDPERLNTADEGPGETLPVGSFAEGASPYGLLDAAGQVAEWTASEQAPGRHFVKGGAWNDQGCGACRPSAREGRPDRQRNVDLGFRLVVE